ncbi:hypothetical protein ACQEVF_24630 [Nonomuraea polychroma]|uniref:hypothetical protein n=1 Tax=Nonomuraea polychroma TaxID=46176 RepID=UPI003D91354A
MARAAILILAGTDTHADLGRLVNALVAAREFKEAGEDVKVIFDGGATEWPHRLTDPGHTAHRLFQAVADVVEGACGFCADAFTRHRGCPRAKVELLREYEGHPSVLGLVRNGYQVITF